MKWIHNIICAIFHPINTIRQCEFVDMVSGNRVGKYECTKCKTVFLANQKRSTFRVYTDKTPTINMNSSDEITVAHINTKPTGMNWDDFMLKMHSKLT